MILDQRKAAEPIRQWNLEKCNTLWWINTLKNMFLPVGSTFDSNCKREIKWNWNFCLGHAAPTYKRCMHMTYTLYRQTCRTCSPLCGLFKKTMFVNRLLAGLRLCQSTFCGIKAVQNPQFASLKLFYSAFFRSGTVLIDIFSGPEVGGTEAMHLFAPWSIYRR